MKEEFRHFSKVCEYLFTTWVNPHPHRFLHAWVDTCIHLGSNTTQRAESSHSRLKKYLGDSMLGIHTSFDKIHKMLNTQFAKICTSFEQSLIRVRHKVAKVPSIAHLRGKMSLHALDLIYAQYEESQKVSAVLSLGQYRCTIQKTHGLPCRHDMKWYEQSCVHISLHIIHEHWRRLSMSPPSTTEELRLEDAREEAIESLDSLEEAPRRQMFQKIINRIKPSKSEIWEPSYHTSHKGRPSSKEERSGARIKSFLESATSMRSGSKSMGTKLFRSQSIGSASTVEGTNNDDVFRSLLPVA
ncbi:hypothetical protein Dimus_039570 [Dionaea muscipula]